MSTLVRARGLAAGYRRDEPAIREVTFTALAGQAVALLGPNGGGKTTLFRALLGELPAQAGEAEIAGRRAYVAQAERSRLDFPVSALDVALMGTYPSTPWYRRTGRRERAIAEAALARVGLADSADTAYGSLSGGQRQRVLIARALAQEPEVMLLDEPLTGVDRRSGERVLAVLDELRAEGRAVLVATHDIHQARRLDRVLCINGRQIAFGSPKEALTEEALQATYGGELVVLDDGTRAVAIQHHAH